MTRTSERPPLAAPAIGVLGTGSYLPGHVVTNDEVGGPAGVDDAWIQQKTGILARRYAKPDEATSDLAVIAGRAALERAGVRAADLSLILVATSTPDEPHAPTATAVAHRLDAPARAAAFDINSLCSGFVFGLDTARNHLIAAGGGHALVIGADIYSRSLNPADRRTTPLLGDGAGAVVLGPVPEGRGIRATRLLSFGGQRDLTSVPAGGSRLPASERTLAEGLHYFTMNGRGVREFVNANVPPALHGFLSDAGCPEDHVDHFVPHQANGRMLEELEAALALPRALTHTTVARYGNTAAASVPITLDEAVRSGAVREGQTVLLAGFGGGMAAGFALIDW
ncbi:3-oxoacyl-ACP synthase III family protein [Streptomyces sp. UNOC14_S4]|uniref:3-oxoacyl-ACP synthase III family protein n=1 Tax=Streptomyces sp. UNOC14_S4 TaxID=2872340 RepID=UPI001E5BD067|nr:ketoacyl-ACP synthase III [Streptomyces sp. UNOC14_S4]